ncbi:MAG: biopolymer transporter ExbD [Parvibaculum sp.]|nr:biopolymer transporter ExbD [Parvibaculum sp.]|tara:strand:+ start:2510 stop:2914 length:405 start_codon:yes stop_codon:yes gene_type:complete
MIEFDEPRRRPPYETMVPLINVVFLLLIFFLLAGTMEPSEPVKVALPSGQIDDKNSRLPATLYLEKDGFVWLGKNMVPPELSGLMVKGFMKEEGTDRIAIKADQDAPADALLTLMEGLRKAGVKEVTLQTESAR